MADLAVDARHVTKIYRLYHSPKDRLRELVSLSGKKYHHEFYALKDVSFTVEKGETFGIMGQNGSGKSTLLKLICGVTRPSSGSVTVNGRVSSLLELGAGFHPEFTGRGNVHMNGALMGLRREEIDERFPEIEAFADIGEFIDQPVKTYSSGMYVRLAFAAAIHAEPDILVVDEALSVGDMFFQAKCVATMNKLIDNGTTLIFVSHDMGAVKKLCQKCVLLDEGRVVEYGTAGRVVEKYFGMKVRKEQAVLSSTTSVSGADREKELLSQIEEPEFQKRASFQRIQNGKARFLNIRLLDDTGRSVATLGYEQQVTLRMAIEVNEDLPALISGYHIRDKSGSDVVYADGVIENKTISPTKKGDEYIVDWSFRVALKHGTYSLACVLSSPLEANSGHVELCDFVPVALQFTVMPRDEWCLHGSVHWENHVEIRNITPGIGGP